MSNDIAWLMAAFLLVATSEGVTIADPVNDAVTRAHETYSGAEAKATSDLIDAFDERIKASARTGQFDAAQQLRAEKAAFVSWGLVMTPDSGAMHIAVAEYRRATAFAGAALRSALESAAVKFTKPVGINDADAIDHHANPQFGPDAPDGGGILLSSDPMLDNLTATKREFAATVHRSQESLRGAIDSKARAAEARGDFGQYKYLLAVLGGMQGNIVAPHDVNDPDIRNANAMFVKEARAAYERLYPAYQGIVCDLIRSRRIDDAVTAEEDLGGGGWLRAYKGD